MLRCYKLVTSVHTAAFDHWMVRVDHVKRQNVLVIEIADRLADFVAFIYPRSLFDSLEESATLAVRKRLEERCFFVTDVGAYPLSTCKE